MRILVADDEKLIRFSIKSMLEELTLPIQSIVFATNGEEMIEVVRSSPPDIAFVDIRMPKLSGLEAIRECKKIAPHTKWVILTSYSSFEYAKEAIKLGADDYLLKPVSAAELEETLSNAIEKQRKEYIALNTEFENWINALLHNTVSSDHPYFKTLLNCCFFGGIFLFDSSLEEQVLLSTQVEFCEKVRDIISTTSTPRIRTGLSILPEGPPAIIALFNSEDPACIQEERERLMTISLEKLCSKFSYPHMRVTFIRTSESQPFPAIQRVLLTLYEISNLRAVIDYWNTLKPEYCSNIDPNLRELSTILIDSVEIYREGDYLGMIKQKDKLEQLLRRDTSFLLNPVKKAVSSFMNVSFGLDLKESFSKTDLLESISKCIDQLLKKKQSGTRGKDSVIEPVLGYIEKNYMDNIGIAQIAYHLKITPNYLSALFHKETGTTFVKYITRIRMNKARELLTDPRMKVQDAAQMVGYFGTRHFSKLFKQYFNYSPSETPKAQESY